MKEHYVEYGNYMKDNIINIFGNMTSAMAAGDEEAVSEELEFFVTCKSCYQTIDYLREFLYDVMNRKVILQFLDTSVCQAKYAASFCNEFRDDVAAELDRFFDTAF